MLVLYGCYDGEQEVFQFGCGQWCGNGLVMLLLIVVVFGGQEYGMFQCLLVIIVVIYVFGMLWVDQVDGEGWLVWQCGIKQMDWEVVVDVVIGELVDVECGDYRVVGLFGVGQFFYVVGYVVFLVGCWCGWFVVVFVV